MRVFVLCTGRCGSMAFVEACKHIENFSAGHETFAYDKLNKSLYEERFNYPDNHIEADNRLAWFLGDLNKRFRDDDTFYVHLKRDKRDTVMSYNKRWSYHNKVSIVRAFANGILMIPYDVPLTAEQRLEICEMYYDAVNANIEEFLRTKSRKMMIDIETIKDTFPTFCSQIGASVNLEKALLEFDFKHNHTVINAR